MRNSKSVELLTIEYKKKRVDKKKMTTAFVWKIKVLPLISHRNILYTWELLKICTTVQLILLQNCIIKQWETNLIYQLASRNFTHLNNHHTTIVILWILYKLVPLDNIFILPKTTNSYLTVFFAFFEFLFYIS